MEIVGRRMELMTEEFEEMRRTKLFTECESRETMKKRKNFEYKINGVSKNLQDFKDYIKYEKALLEELRLKRNKGKISDKKGSLEHRIMGRIKNLYEIAIQRFPNDRAFCISFFKFCKQANYIHAASLAVTNLLQNHSSDPGSWQIAAKWHAYDRKDISAAIKIMCKGIALHKHSKLLYMEVIELEIYSAVGKNWSKKSSSTESFTNKEVMCLEKLQTYVKEMVANISDYSVFIELLNYLEEYKFTLKAQNLIIDHLLKMYVDKVEVWHVLAQRECKGLQCGSMQNLNSVPTKTRLNRCSEKYKEGLDKVPESRKIDLWSLYLDCLIEQRQDDFGVANVFKTKALINAYEQACSEGHLSAKYFISWMEHDTNQANVILEKGTLAWPQSVELWKLRLKYHIMKDDVSAIEDVFYQGIMHLKHESLPLWMARLRYHLLTSTDDRIDFVYQEGIKQPKEISDIMKPRYLEWLALVKGMDETRAQYLKMASERQYCKSIHMTMSRLESTEIYYNFDAWEEVHKIACEQFGKEDVEVWINYIQFYCYYKKVENNRESIKRIYEDAKSNLPNLLFLDFQEMYNNINVTYPICS